MCCACKSYVVFALLPAQCAVCVSPVLCLHYCQYSVLCVYVLCDVFAQCSASTFYHSGATTSPLIIIILFCCILLHYCQHSVLCM